MPDTNDLIEERISYEHWQTYMEVDFDPRHVPRSTPCAEHRMVAAMEYAAYQLGQINHRLGRLMELTEGAVRDRH